MAETHHHNEQTEKELPQVLVFGPPLTFRHFESLHSHKYRFLKAYASPLPLHQFLITNHVHPSMIRAILCNPHQRITTDIIQLLPSLGLIVTSSAGTDHIDLAECRRRGVQVATVGGYVSDDVADLAVGLFMDVLRKISLADRYARKMLPFGAGNFPLGSKVGGKRVGIVGLGSIGMEVAKRLEAMGCRIRYHSRKEKPFVSYPFYSNIIELAASSDALVLCCALNAETRHIINREVILALGKEGVVVNIGRGALIDEKEMVRCLIEGEIVGAGLDVYENEPNVHKELFVLDNVVLSPHAASLTSESFNEKCEIVSGNLEAFFSSKPLITPLNVRLMLICVLVVGKESCFNNMMILI